MSCVVHRFYCLIYFFFTWRMVGDLNCNLDCVLSICAACCRKLAPLGIGLQSCQLHKKRSMQRKQISSNLHSYHIFWTSQHICNTLQNATDSVLFGSWSNDGSTRWKKRQDTLKMLMQPNRKKGGKWKYSYCSQYIYRIGRSQMLYMSYSFWLTAVAS